VSARVRLAAKSTAKPPDNSGAEWKRIRMLRHDFNRDERMKIFIQRDPSGHYWHNGGGWIATRELATVYAGVVDALDSCIANCLAKADIVLVFGTGHAEIRLSHKFTP
jgi:hypothetical protein